MNFEVVKSFFETLKERTRNPFSEDNKTPFAGAFLISLLFYNWKIIFSFLTFDSYETRLSKIETIDDFLTEKSLFCRLLVPVLAAFISIIFYYTFNNISLFITTFFNSWIKPFVYLILDKSKLATKQELENERELLKKATESNYTIRQKFNESESKLDQLEKELLEKKKEIGKEILEKEKLEKEKLDFDNEILKKDNEKAELINKINSFEVIFSKYGYKDKFFDITIRVIDLIKNNNEFYVDNNTLLSTYDDVYYKYNSIEITYKYNGLFFNKSASQFELIKIENNEIKVYETDKSNVQKTIFDNNLKLFHFFEGQWKLDFSKGYEKGEEILNISEFGEYFTNTEFVFKLENVDVDLSKNTIKFDKIKVEDNLKHSSEILKIINNNLITGKDSLGYSLRYSRANKQLVLINATTFPRSPA